MLVVISHFVAATIGMITGIMMLCMAQVCKKRHTEMIDDDA